HTRFSRDWSSDVCSSDLRGIPEGHRTAGWLEPHVVTVVDLPAVPLRLATFTRVDRVTIPPTTVRVTNRGMCPVVAYATCPNRYRSEERSVGKEGRTRSVM